MRYARPRSIDEALHLMAERPWRVLAGGTDFYPSQGTRPVRDDVLDIGALDGLCGLSRTDGHLVIGARTTWSDIARADLHSALDAFRLAAREVGSVQIQNAGTVAGNLCNASPAADGVPPLLAVDAEVELSSLRGVRYLGLADFLQGNRKTARGVDELVTAIRIPDAALQGRSYFAKLGARRYLVISIAMVSARLTFDDAGRIAQAAVAVGACSAVAQRLGDLESALIGAAGEAEIDAIVRNADLATLSPIDDVRASADYRRTAARETVRRALREIYQARHFRNDRSAAA
ncbi:FAD binding domain-containing protein [Aliihoeflea sp. PC F10.4]